MKSLISRTLAVLAIAGAAVFAADKPNYTGDWKLNKAKSELGPMADRMPETVVVKIVHEEPNLTVSQPGMGGRNQESKLTTDGKENVTKRQGSQGEMAIKTKAMWEGDDLALNTSIEFGQGTMTQTEKWTLSEDKKVLTIHRKASSPMGDMEMKQVLEKQ
ncbi:MAG: hypothetical protein SFV18_12565 [Bryobacteraceae bacterium]|nr:hypothetical protein [Bryobacteraceae bacterium]